MSRSRHEFEVECWSHGNREAPFTARSSPSNSLGFSQTIPSPLYSMPLSYEPLTPHHDRAAKLGVTSRLQSCLQPQPQRLAVQSNYYPYPPVSTLEDTPPRVRYIPIQPPPQRASFDKFYVSEPPVQVEGSYSALSALNKAITQDRLSVQTRDIVSDTDAFQTALLVLQEKQILPNLSHRGFGLELLTEHERLCIGIEPDDCTVDPNRSVRNLIYPPFLFHQLSIDVALTLLRMLTKYQESSGLGSWNVQIGVVTRLSNGAHHADLLSSRPEQEATHTVWMLREIIGNPALQGGYTESFKGFVSRLGVSLPQKEQPAYHFFDRPHSALDSWYGQDTRRTNTLKQSHLPASASTAPRSGRRKLTTSVNGRKSRHAGKLDHAGMPREDFSHLTVEEILDGAVDPDAIAGDLLLLLVEHYTYTEVAERLNVVRHSLGRDPTSKNNMWQRVKAALKAKARAQGSVSWEQLKVQLDAKRNRDLNLNLRVGEFDYHCKPSKPERSSSKNERNNQSRQSEGINRDRHGGATIDDGSLYGTFGHASTAYAPLRENRQNLAQHSFADWASDDGRTWGA